MMIENKTLDYLHLHEADRDLYIRRDQVRWFRQDLSGGTNIQMLDKFTTTVKESIEDILEMANYGVIENGE